MSAADFDRIEEALKKRGEREWGAGERMKNAIMAAGNNLTVSVDDAWGALGDLRELLTERDAALADAAKLRDALREALYLISDELRSVMDVGDLSQGEWDRRAEELIDAWPAAASPSTTGREDGQA